MKPWSVDMQSLTPQWPLDTSTSPLQRMRAIASSSCFSQNKPIKTQVPTLASVSHTVLCDAPCPSVGQRGKAAGSLAHVPRKQSLRLNGRWFQLFPGRWEALLKGLELIYKRMQNLQLETTEVLLFHIWHRSIWRWQRTDFEEWAKQWVLLIVSFLVLQP